MNEQQHQKWLKKMGVTGLKSKRKIYRPSTSYAKDYYEEKPLSGRVVLKSEMDLSKETPELRRIIEQKHERILAENSKGPRDLNYDIGEIRK